MARLINDSGVLGDEIVTAATVADVPLNKMFEAIHKIQEQMGITGTTAAEAADTISGSFAATKAAWSNLLSGLASDDKSMDTLMDNLFESGENLITNVARLVPRIGKNALEAFDSFLERFDIYKSLKNAYKSDGISGVVDTLQNELKEEFTKLAPIAVDAGADLIAGLYTGLTGDTTSKEEVKAYFSGLWQDVLETKNVVAEKASGILGEIYAGLTGDEASNASIKGVFTALWNEAAETGNVVVTSAQELLGGIYTGLTGQEATKKNIIDTIKGLFSGGAEEMETLKTNASGLLSGIATAIDADDTKPSDIGKKLGELFSEASTAMDTLKSEAKTLLSTIYKNITGEEATAQSIGKKIGGIFNSGVTAIMGDGTTENPGLLSVATTFFSDLNNALGDPDASIGEKIGGVFSSVGTAAQKALVTGSTFLSDLYATISGDTEGAKNLKNLGVELFGTQEQKDSLMLKQDIERYGIDFVQNQAGMASFLNEQAKEFVNDLWDFERLGINPYEGNALYAQQYESGRQSIIDSLAANGMPATGEQADALIAGMFSMWKDYGKDEENLPEYWFENMGDAIMQAYSELSTELTKREHRMEEQEPQTQEPEAVGALSSLPDIAAALQLVTDVLAKLPADMTEATREGCAAGVGSITVTGNVSTGNVMLNSGALVGMLAPSLNLRLGVLNRASGRG